MKILFLFLMPLLLSACVAVSPPPPYGPAPLPSPDPYHPESFIGLPLPAAQAAADRAGLPHRVIERDGVPLPSTRDFNPQRLNFAVARNRVVRVTRG